MEIYGVEHVQQEMVGIIRNHKRRCKRNSGGYHVDMDVLETVHPGVGMGDHRGNDDHIPGAVIQAAVVEQEGTGAAGAVNKLPAFMRVPGYGEDGRMLAHIGDFVHTGPSLRGVSGMIQRLSIIVSRDRFRYKFFMEKTEQGPNGRITTGGITAGKPAETGTGMICA